MNKFLFIALSIVVMMSCKTESSDSTINTDVINNHQSANESEQAVAAEDLPIMTFEQVAHEFGSITQGEVVNATFTFTNTGKTELVISTASATCGCTVPEWPKQPIAPGEKGEIKVVFNSSGKVGPQNKVVTITANTSPAQNQVALKGDVLVPENTEEG